MRRGITIRDVADRAGVSIATASRVLSGHKATSPASRSAVLRAARDLDFSPNALARSLRSARTTAVGLLVSDIRNPFFSELTYVIQTALFELGYSTMVGNASEQEVLQDQYLDALRSQRIAGLLCAPQGAGSPALTKLAAEGLPMVFVDRTLPVPGVPFVDSDPAPGIEQALTRFAADGHQRVGFVAGPQLTSTGVERRTVFEQLAQGRFEFARVVLGGYDEAVCTAGVRSLLDDGCTALLFGYSPNAVTALRALADAGLQLPEAVSLVSFDEIPLFELLNPPVSVIRQGIADMGRRAVDSLMAVMAGERVDDHRLASAFDARGTNGPAPSTGGLR